MTFYDSIGPLDNQERENKIVRKALTALPEPFLSGLKLKADISLYRYDEKTDTATELIFNTIDENDVVWVVSDIDGWWTLPEPELPDLPRGWGDGSYDAIGRWVNRILTLNGSFLPQVPEDAPTARTKLIDALSVMVKSKSAGYLIVNEPNPSGGFTRRSAKVRLSGTPLITSVNARGRHDFSIGLKAVDPIKYEFVAGDPDGYQIEPISVGAGGGAASVAISNTGNTPVPIIIELSAGFTVSNPEPLSAPRITNATNEQFIDIIKSTPANTRLEIDTYNREVLLVTYDEGVVDNVENGRSNLPIIVDWIYLEPGVNTITLERFPANSTCNIYYKSGWIG